MSSRALGAQGLLQGALEAGLSANVAAHQDEREEQGRAMVLRNGRARWRKVTSGSRTLTVQAPRLDNRRLDEAGERQRFRSRILPSYMRCSPKVAEGLPILSQRGLATGGFREALPVLFGEEAAGLPLTTITRLPPTCLERPRRRIHLGRWAPHETGCGTKPERPFGPRRLQAGPE